MIEPNVDLPAAAKVWGISARSAYRYAELGLIHVARFGKRMTITPDEVDRVAREGVSVPVRPNLAPPRPGRRRGRA
jgi:hypothetical protein